MSRVKVLVDSSIPSLEYIDRSYYDVIKFNIDTKVIDIIEDIDALIIRSTLKVDKKLLDKAKNLKFIGTATSGEDHLDLEEINKKNISCFNAKGINSDSVRDYVISCILSLKHKFPNKKINKAAVISSGNVGAKVTDFIKKIANETFSI